MQSERDKLDSRVVLVAMSGIVLAALANEAHESVRCLGVTLGFCVLLVAFVYGAWRQ